MCNMTKRKKNADFERREANPEICECFGRLDALYHEAMGRRLERSAQSLETVEDLLCAYGMPDTEQAWAWWMRNPDYGRDCADPLAYFMDGSVCDDIRILAFADGARSRLAARVLKIQKAACASEGASDGDRGGRGSL